MTGLPFTYFVSVLLAALMLVYGGVQIRKSWSLPYLAVVLTIFAWYFIEPIYTPQEFRLFDPLSIERAYDAVLITLISFGVSAPAMVSLARPKQSGRKLSSAHIPAERVLLGVAGVWLVLLIYGTVRMRGDLFGSLFPIGGRSGSTMWSRSAGAGAGNDGFVVSAASYLYILCLASFGVLFFLVSRKGYPALAVFLIMISWPYVFLDGSRNLVLAVALPTLFSFVLFSRTGRVNKGLVLVVAFLALDFAFRAIYSFRSEGFANMNISRVEASRHAGLNMASELVYCLKFLADGVLHPSYGGGYLAELANMVPRTIWPDKPLIGIDYAVVRGFSRRGNDIGVFATISSGLIGGGVLNFGPVFGPMFAGLFMSFWTGLLARFRSQGTPLRLTLFLIGLGLTFNLGRDITLLVLWPLLFGYIGVRVVEWRTSAARHQHRVSRQQRP